MAAEDMDLRVRWVERRDPGAFRDLVAGHVSMVYATCRRVLGNATDAEDVAQECFETLALLPQWPEAPLGAWLHRVATNRSLNRLKSERRRVQREDRYAREHREESDVDWDDVYRYVDEAITALPGKYREPLVARFLEGRAHAAIAEATGVPRRTVTYRIDRGVALVRDALRKRGIPVSTTVLAALLGEAMAAEAAPASLTASLGRIALAGLRASTGVPGLSTGSTAIAGWLAAGGALAMWQKTTIVCGALVVVLLACLWMALPGEPRSVSRATMTAPEPPHADDTEEAAVVAAVEQAGPDSPVPAPSTEASVPPVGSAAVEGTAFDDAGYVIEGAQVRLEVWGDGLGFDVRGAYEASTDAQGAFRIDGIRDFGAARAFASREGYLQAVSPRIELQPGATRGSIALELKKAQNYVSGWVVDPQRRPVKDAEVSLRHYEIKDPSRGSFFTGEAKMASAFTDAKGWFWIGVPHRADCDFTVTKAGFGAGYFPEISTGTDDAWFTLRAGGAIAGTVRRTDGTPVSGATVRAAGAADLTGQPKGVMPAGIQAVSALTKADGGYAITGLGVDYLYTVSVGATSEAGAGSAQRNHVKVASGRTTSGVDFVLHPLEPVRVHGRVTDRASGEPAYPILVRATVVEPGKDFVGDASAEATTDADGAYALSLQVARQVELRMEWDYADGAFAFPHDRFEGKAPERTPAETPSVVKVIPRLEPGRDETLDFTVNGPIVVPVRFVDPAGEPQEGVEARIKQGEASWGSSTLSGPDGRAVHRGLCPGVTFQILASVDEPERMTIGESEPFSGEPGETLPEVVVVCRYKSGVEGILVDEAGRPVGRTEIGCTAVLEDGTVMTPSSTTTAEDGSFVILHGLPYNTYKAVGVGYVRDGQIERGIVENVDIPRGQVVNLGTIACERVMAVEDAQRLQEDGGANR